jgi:hypothetical protein
MDISHLISTSIAHAAAPAADQLGAVPQGAITSDAKNGVTELASRLLNDLLFLAYPLSFAAVVYSAYLLISSAGNPDAWTKAKKNITNLVIGIFFIVFASILVAMFRKLLSIK